MHSPVVGAAAAMCLSNARSSTMVLFMAVVTTEH